MQVCTRVRGKAASIASGQPFSLSSTRCTTVGSASCSELRLPLAVVLAPLLPIVILLSAPLCPVTYVRNAGRLSDPIWPSKGPTVAPALSTARHRYLRLPTRITSRPKWRPSNSIITTVPPHQSRRRSYCPATVRRKRATEPVEAPSSRMLFSSNASCFAYGCSRNARQRWSVVPSAPAVPAGRRMRNVRQGRPQELAQ
jgi:hypothetical protein